ncbi:BTAD domain-containing putative transcriptional regulator [Actinoallomurus bryophytorum]|uniref:Transcriptional regulator n=1 Tax=Actinoallomurus bryophytorum TaxID=1490222 RepID=A0A543CTL6_9ACTN|nr:BTAD domain-containing putative transcriptional regulator [Actinoallomurus bryophytorum]TQM00456.1 transcriptional regulator [Actinoallomurus bryophytorum]
MARTSPRVDLLGPVRMSVDARPVALGSGLRLAAFVVLASGEGRAVTRRELVNALWGARPPATADGSVYTYVAGLRRALAAAGAPDLLVSDRDGYRLAIPPEALDLTAFTRLSAEAAALVAGGDDRKGIETYARALHLSRGEPLSGVPGPFAESRREQLGAALLATQEAHAAARLEHGAHAEVAAELASLIDLFPLRESLRELRMRALHRAGRHVEALALFSDTREILRRELGAEPSGSLRRLHQRILTDDGPGTAVRKPAAPESQHGPAAVRRPAAPRFVGRTDVLDLLRHHLAELRHGRGGSVWLEGDPGIGKSEVVAVALHEPDRRDHHVAWATADELTSRFPLQVMLDCLGIHPETAETERALLAQNLWEPEPAGYGFATQDPTYAPSRRLREHIEALCAERPLVLVLDDLHWADAVTLRLVERLLPASGEMPLLLVTTARSGWKGTGMSAVHDRVAATGGTVVRLGPLSAGEADELTGHLVGARQGPILRRLTTRAEGNPLYITELVRGLMRTQSIEIVDGMATVEPRQAGLAPRTLQSALDRASRTVSEHSRDMLRWLAVLGDDVPVQRLFEVLMPAGRNELQDSIEESVSAGLLVDAGDRLRFRHPLLREVVYEEIARSFRGVMHAQAARALAVTGAPGVSVAEHLVGEDTDMDDWAVEWLSANAPHLGDTAPEVTAQLIERALLECRMDRATRETLRMILVRLLFRLARLPESSIRQVLATAVDPVHLAELNLLLAAVQLRAGRPEAGVETLNRTRSGPLVPQVWDTRRRLLMRHLERAVDASRFRVPRAEGSPGTPAADPVAVVHRLTASWYSNTAARNHPAALENVRDAIELIRAHPEADGPQADLHELLVHSLHYVDRFPEAAEVIERCHADKDRTDPALMWIPEALHHFWTGAWDADLAALESVRRPSDATSLGVMAEVGPSANLIGHGLAAYICQLRGDRPAVARHLDTLRPIPIEGAVEREACSFFLRAEAFELEHEGDPAAAFAKLGETSLDPEFAPLQTPYKWFPYLLRLAQEMADQDKVDRVMEAARREARRTVGSRGAQMALYRCQALALREPGLAVRAAAHYREVGRRLERAEALAEAAGLFAAGDRPDEARTAVTESVRLYRSFGAHWWAEDLKARLTNLRAVTYRPVS